MNLARFATSVLCVLSLAVAGCEHLTPGQKKAISTAFGVAGDVTQFAAGVAVGKIVLAKATGPEDALNKANKFDSAALALRTLEGESAGVLTPQVVSTTLSQFTDPNKAHWGALASSLADKITAAPDKNVALEQAAVGLNQTALITRTTVAADAGNP